MKLQILILSILAILNLTTSTDSQDLTSQPTAKCQPGFFYRTLPLIADQAYITNLDHLFNGYNLEYKLEEYEDFKEFIQLGDKLTLQGKEIPDVPLIGLKSYHIDKRGNSWGSTFIALTERSERTFVHYGVINSNTSAPIVNNYISVENKTDITCFDAVLFKEQNLILVDCVKKLPTPNTRGQVLQNWFYYFRISDGQLLKKLKTDLYINLRSISKRSLMLYSDLRNQHTFLLRTYYYNELQKPYNENTFIEVFMITDPNDPWIVEIIDRAFLDTKTLSITDVKIYLGEIFVLDKKMGLYRVYINTEEDLKFKGYYEVKGYDRFSVYSSNLQDNFQLALANSHSALQLDWTNNDQPRLINKYSLMPDTLVSQIFINDRFLFIQSSSASQNKTYNYTWIFNRGDRTYTKAFKVIKHNTAKTIIDLNEEMSYLIVIDDEKLVNYKVDDTNMVIKLKQNQQMMNKLFSFKIVATSREQMDEKNVKKCQVQINFTLVAANNKTMWPIGDLPPSTFTANFPGKVQVHLHEYVFGPNITYKLRQADHDVVKKLKVYQQQQLNIQWQTQPPFITDNSTKIKFLLTQTVNYQSLPYDLMHLYMQDEKNVTYFVQCTPNHLSETVLCNFTHEQQFEGEVNSWVSGFFINSYTMEENHLIAYTTKKYSNKVELIDFTQNQRLTEVILQKGFAGNATSIAITQKEMYVVLKYVKNILIYDLQLCLQDLCEPKCKLDYIKMYQLGIKYFSPTQVHTSIHHPNILFIKTTDQLIVIDYNAQCKPKLLATLQPVESAELQFSFKLNQNHLIITIESLNLIQQYNIERISIGDIRLTKSYPVYGYKLPKMYDLDVSDKGQCVYVTMLSQDGDYQVFVYRTGYPAVGTLYDVIDLTSAQNVLVDSTGLEIDYVSVYANTQLHIFRQYQQPLAQVFNPNISYSFYIDYSNPSSRANLQQIDVKIINLPTYIKLNPWLNDIMNTKNLLYSGKDVVNQINDSSWWQGNVLSVDADCEDCKGDQPLIQVMNHIQHKEEQKLVPGMTEYQWTQQGGAIQQTTSLINIRSNGTVRQITKIPFTEIAYCTTLTVGHKEQYQVSGCISNGAITLHLTSFISSKPFTYEPFETTALSLFKLQATYELIILIDTEPDPYRKSRPGGIHLFAVNHDAQIPSPLILVEYIDGDDTGMEELGQLYINNAQLAYHPVTNSYRLYFTEMTRGVFVMEFTYSQEFNNINIRAINRLKIEPLLTQLNYQLPYDATYQAITRMQSTYDPTLKKITDKMLLTTGKFHTMELTIDFGLQGTVQQVKLTRLYQRYAFYNIQNYIKYHNSLFVVAQVLPQEFYVENRSKQILTIYSTSENRSFTEDPQDDDVVIDKDIVDENKTIDERGFLGGFRVDDTIMHSYDFNLTYQDDGHTEPRVGMVLIEYLTNRLQKFTLHQNLSVVTKELVDTQIIFIDLKNDFSLQKIRILINGRSPFPEWLFIAIILSSVIGGVLLLGVMYVAVSKLRQRLSGGGDQGMQDSLLTSERKSFEPLSMRESEDLSSKRESTNDKKKKQKQMQKDQKKLQKEEKQRSKQRQRQEKERQKQKLREQKDRERNDRQRERESERQSQRNRQKDRESERDRQRERQRESQRERERERQRERQRERSSQNRMPRNQTRNQTRNQPRNEPRNQTRNEPRNNYQQQNREQDLTAPFSRYGERERRAFRDRPERPVRGGNNQTSSRPQPPARRRNIAIIED